jgi:hypothetical protein
MSIEAGEVQVKLKQLGVKLGFYQKYFSILNIDFLVPNDRGSIFIVRCWIIASPFQPKKPYRTINVSTVTAS